MWVNENFKGTFNAKFITVSKTIEGDKGEPLEVFQKQFVLSCGSDTKTYADIDQAVDAGWRKAPVKLKKKVQEQTDTAG